MKWDALHSVNSPLLEMFKPKLAIGQEYFRRNSTITRSERNSSAPLVRLLFYRLGQGKRLFKAAQLVLEGKE